jgi:hypothetical protein
MEDRKVKQVLPGGWHQCGGYRKGCRRVNVVEYYVLMHENGKMRPVETIPGMGERDKGEWWRGEFNHDTL